MMSDQSKEHTTRAETQTVLGRASVTAQLQAKHQDRYHPFLNIGAHPEGRMGFLATLDTRRSGPHRDVAVYVLYWVARWNRGAGWTHYRCGDESLCGWCIETVEKQGEAAR